MRPKLKTLLEFHLLYLRLPILHFHGLFLAYMYCSNLSLLIRWSSQMENGQQSAAQQARITEHEEQMPRWKHCPESRQLSHPNWRLISLCSEADSANQCLQTSAVWCLISPAFLVAFVNTLLSLCTQSSSIEPSVKWGICFLGCHFTASHFGMLSHSTHLFPPASLFFIICHL